MEKILSQEEIDALLSGLSEGKIDTTPEVKEEVKAKPFDFRNYTISTRLKIPGLEVINEQLARSLRMQLSTLLREMLDISNLPLQMERFKDFLNKIPVPTSIHIFKLEPLKGQSLLIIDATLAFLFIERFLGGERKHIKVEGREFTPIEQRLLKKVVDLIFNELEKAWKNIYPVKPKYIRGEVNPQFARVLMPEETVVVTGYTLELESLSGKILFCYSLSTLQPIKDKLYSPYQLEEYIDLTWKKNLENYILNSSVQLKAILGKGTITLEDLVNLEVGDVVILDKKIEEPIEVYIEGVPKILGKLGVFKNHLAIQVDKFLSSENPENTEK
ncbi:MAG: Flagellar motor switch protein FliM [Thermodesulfobacterium sp. 37_54]|uniref:Flagellar motor switch protein FliM n=1 Tax=Thermodesulfobacterium commune DSM 2178 TaxID=289377 RepID=A0A075WSE2_9BACT|nr:flagellar motor switch protein FliM [Thermodesulfobacterium commune]KUJ97051.1 MAG: Flagellar motor switch protein FliM [Thermodesulfobacterium sp. 37_54]AIH03781.1 flagellar motor switch protein FliM [Thermodesulfobacterium commune DSM 2178]KUK18838.1 MAG: Flagellar motor switch protein FliM [Thermodesulfobacterium commune]HBT04090.1 flagellar motor switch protein FliM [Thermodesulfobacterium commune]HCE79611.1 flagellar motor switch protein FliM [Thermodesulfobacterium commune]